MQGPCSPHWEDRHPALEKPRIEGTSRKNKGSSKESPGGKQATKGQCQETKTNSRPSRTYERRSTCTSGQTAAEAYPKPRKALKPARTRIIRSIFIWEGPY